MCVPLLLGANLLQSTGAMNTACRAWCLLKGAHGLLAQRMVLLSRWMLSCWMFVQRVRTLKFVLSVCNYSACLELVATLMNRLCMPSKSSGDCMQAPKPSISAHGVYI